MERVLPEKYFSLSELANSIQSVVRNNYAKSYWIKAEVAKLNYYQKSGHCYPDLVEKSEEKILAQMRGIIWSSDFQRITLEFVNKTGQHLTEGMEILFLCKPEYSPNHGLSLLISDINPEFTLGKLVLEKQKTIVQLKANGLFELNRSKIFPRLPKRLAIISVVSSKGYLDFKNVLDTHYHVYPIQYKLFTALLQGDKAIESIVEQLNIISTYSNVFDAVAIIRGGGGEVGLSCYDSEDLASAVAKFTLPVLTGIGHSTNETVVEMVSFRAFITPTELAYFILSRFDIEKDLLLSKAESIRKLSLDHLHQKSIRFSRIANKVKSVFNDASKQEKSQLQLAQSSLNFALQSQITKANSKQNVLRVELRNRMRHQLNSTRYIIENKQFNFKRLLSFVVANKKNRLDFFEDKINHLNPQILLEKGYTLVFKDEQLIKKSSEVVLNEKLDVRFSDGIIQVKVISKNKDN